MQNNSGFIPKHGGYKNLKSFQNAETVYDFTVEFCKVHIDRTYTNYKELWYNVAIKELLMKFKLLKYIFAWVGLLVVSSGVAPSFGVADSASAHHVTEHEATQVTAGSNIIVNQAVIAPVASVIVTNTTSECIWTGTLNLHQPGSCFSLTLGRVLVPEYILLAQPMQLPAIKVAHVPVTISSVALTHAGIPITIAVLPQLVAFSLLLLVFIVIRLINKPLTKYLRLRQERSVYIHELCMQRC